MADTATQESTEPTGDESASTSTIGSTVDEVWDQLTADESAAETETVAEDNSEPEPEGSEPAAEVGESEGDEPEPAETYEVQLPTGEVVHLSVDDLKGGYMRQADYTRKTQELAERRQDLDTYYGLVEFLESNPQAAIAEIAKLYKVDLENQMADQGLGFEPDPVQSELEAIKARQAQWEQQAQREQLTQQLHQQTQQLHRQNEPDADLEDYQTRLWETALDLGTNDLSQAAAVVAERVRVANLEAEVRRMKESLPPVSGGSDHAPPPVQDGPQSFSSLDAALEAAYASSGYES